MPDLQQGALVDNNPADPVAAPAEAVATETTNGTVETPSGQAETQAQAAPAEEQFSDVDPKTLPPELQTLYKKMQSGFTKKMQGLTEAQKKAEIYDQLAGDKDFVSYWEQKIAKGQDPSAAQPEPLVNDQEYAEALSSPQGFEKIMQKVIAKAVEPLAQKARAAEASDILEEFAAEPGHEDLYALQEDELISIQLRLDPPKNERDYRAKVQEAYTRAKDLTQKYFQKGYEKAKAEAMGVIQNKVNAASNPPTINAGKTYEGPDPKDLTGADAYRLAKKGVRVPQ